MHELGRLSQISIKAYDEFNFNRAMVELAHFCTSTLSSFYFEIIKDSLYADSLKAERRKAIVWTLKQVGETHHLTCLLKHGIDDGNQLCAKLLPVMMSIAAPVIPHLAEDVWQHWPGKDPTRKEDDDESFFQYGWQEADSRWNNNGLAEKMELLKTVRSEIMKLLEQARRDK